MIPQAPPFDESMLPPGSMRPVFLKPMPEPAGVAADAAQVNAAAAVRTRAAYFAALAADPDFTAHMLDGWLAAQESGACQILEHCPQGEVIEARSTWKALKSLRQRLRDEVMSAPARLKA